MRRRDGGRWCVRRSRRVRFLLLQTWQAQWEESQAPMVNQNRKTWRRGTQPLSPGHQSFFGRPVFSCGKPASTFCRVARSIWLISATPMRSNSLFLISKPAFRQAFLTWPSTSYSASGMVKLSRTSFGLRAFSLATATGLATALATGFATALTAGLAAALTAGLAAAAFAAGLDTTLAAGFAATLATGFAAGLAAGLAATLATAFTGALAAGLTAALATVALATGLAAGLAALIDALVGKIETGADAAAAVGLDAGLAAAFFTGTVLVMVFPI